MARLGVTKKKKSPRTTELSQLKKEVQRLGDERKIKQVLLNLLSNAVKFTPEGGRIGIKARQADDAVEISVSDTGIGIAPEDQAGYLKNFARSEATMRTREKELDLG